MAELVCGVGTKLRDGQSRQNSNMQGKGKFLRRSKSMVTIKWFIEVAEGREFASRGFI